MRKIPRAVTLAACLSAVVTAAVLYYRQRFEPLPDDLDNCDGCECGHPAENECEVAAEVAKDRDKAYRPTFSDGSLGRPSRDLFKEE